MPHESAVTFLKALSNEMAGNLVPANPHDYYRLGMFEIRSDPKLCHLSDKDQHPTRVSH